MENQKAWLNESPNGQDKKTTKCRGEAALEVGLETCAASSQAVRSYSQFEFVVRGFLPTVNLAGKT